MSERLERLATLCQEYEVVILYFFGSRAKEVKAWFNEEINTLPESGSDVDVGVKPAVGTEFKVYKKVRLALAIEDMLNVSRVDLVLLDDADPFLAANIIRGERLFADDSYLAEEYDLYVLRRAGDLAPLERERMALILKEKT